jgi:hypothetical protein
MVADAAFEILAFGDLLLDDPALDDPACDDTADDVLAVCRVTTVVSSAMAAPGLSIMPALNAVELNKRKTVRRPQPAPCFATISPPGCI